MTLTLTQIKRTDKRLLANMKNHYSQPKGFVGRNQCYAIEYGGKYYGGIVSGSTTLHLPGRKQWLHDNWIAGGLNNGINNIFFHIEGPYPCRNFAQKVFALWRERAVKDWQEKYGNKVTWFETLVELPRTGEIYLRDKWQVIGETKGFTCKREDDPFYEGTDDWSGKRVWDTENLRPKLVLVRKP